MVLACNPRLYIYPNFNPTSAPILIIGMPGWGGRSENFIWSLINGLKLKSPLIPSLTSRLMIAAIQDPGKFSF